jgi:hypothetical protein
MSELLPYEVKPRAFEWEVPDGLDADAVPIAREIVRLGRRYVAGAIALDSGGSAAVGVLALTSAALGAILSFLNPSRRAVESAAKARACWAVVMRTRLFVAADLARADAVAARSLLIEIQELEAQALDSLSPTP